MILRLLKRPAYSIQRTKRMLFIYFTKPFENTLLISWSYIWRNSFSICIDVLSKPLLCLDMVQFSSKDALCNSSNHEMIYAMRSSCCVAALLFSRYLMCSCKLVPLWPNPCFAHFFLSSPQALF